MLAGIRISPVAVPVSISTCCVYIGIISSKPKNRNTAPARITTQWRNCLYSNARRFSSGVARRDWRYANQPTSATEAANSRINSASGRLAKLLLAYTSPPNPTIDSTADKISIFGRLMVLKLTVRYLPTNTIAASINGAVKPNSTRQCVWSMMMPDSVGPIAGAAVNIMVITPIAVPRLFGG